jgi:transforming growth factor-beta-induced protein
MKRTIFLTVAAAALVVSACSGSSSTPAPATAAPATPAASMAPESMAPESMAPESMAPATGDIVDTATAAGSFTTLLQAATAAGLVDTLKGPGPFTVFAPTDDAFAALPAGTLDGLLKDPEALKQILLYHVVAGKVTSDQVVGLTSADTVAGQPISIAVKDGEVYLNDTVKVVMTDIEASNGVIHVIDGVLLPPAS